MKAYYIPGSLPNNVRLLPPQPIYKLVGGTFVLEGDRGILSLPDKSPLMIPLDPGSYLPCCEGSLSRSISSVASSVNLCVTDEHNQNLTTSQKLLLMWHYRFAHLNFKAVQWILRSGVFGKSPIFIAASKCDAPKCAACEFGKAKRRPTKSSITTPVAERENVSKLTLCFQDNGSLSTTSNALPRVDC